MAKRFPWKINFLKVPPAVRRALDDINDDLYQVAATKKVAREEIERGQYAHIGLRSEEGAIVIDGPTLPPVDAGKLCARSSTKQFTAHN